MLHPTGPLPGGLLGGLPTPEFLQLRPLRGTGASARGLLRWRGAGPSDRRRLRGPAGRTRLGACLGADGSTGSQRLSAGAAFFLNLLLPRSLFLDLLRDGIDDVKHARQQNQQDREVVQEVTHGHAWYGPEAAGL